MSDLQLALVVIGALVIAGVYAFNRLQERQFRRRMERALDDRSADALMAPSVAGPLGEGERIEPQLSAPAAAEVFDAPPAEHATAPRPEAAAPAAGAQSLPESPIDYLCGLEAPAGLPAAALAELLKSLHAIGKPASLQAYDAATGQWVALPSNAVASVTRVAASLQLADRNGPVNRVQLSSMRDLLQDFAQAHDARLRCPDLDLAAQAAVELDRFCAAVDVSIGCSVVPAVGLQFPGTKVRGLLESAGFAADPGGRYVLRTEDGGVLMWAEDIDGHPMSPERMRSSALGGLVLTLDAPRVPSKARTFERMVELGRHLAQALEGTVVDDNRVALNEAGLKLVREQLDALHDSMLARGIPAGGALAERLFS